MLKARARSLRGSPGEGDPPEEVGPEYAYRKNGYLCARSQCVIGYITRLGIGQSLLYNGASTFLMGAPGIDKEGVVFS